MTRASNHLVRRVQPEPATGKKAGASMTVRGANTIQPADLGTSSRAKDGTNTTKYEVKGGLTRRIRIYNKYFFVEYESQDHIDRLLAEFLSRNLEGNLKHLERTGKQRKLWRCVMCGEDDFCNKMQYNTTDSKRVPCLGRKNNISISGHGKRTRKNRGNV